MIWPPPPHDTAIKRKESAVSIEVTDEMIDAGLEAMFSYSYECMDRVELAAVVEEIFRAMTAVARSLR